MVLKIAHLEPGDFTLKESKAFSITRDNANDAAFSSTSNLVFNRSDPITPCWLVNYDGEQIIFNTDAWLVNAEGKTVDHYPSLMV